MENGYVVTQGDYVITQYPNDSHYYDATMTDVAKNDMLTSDHSSAQIVQKTEIRGVVTGVNRGAGSVLSNIRQNWLFYFVLPIAAILLIEIVFVVKNFLDLRHEKNKASLQDDKEAMMAELEAEKEKMRQELLAELRAQQAQEATEQVAEATEAKDKEERVEEKEDVEEAPTEEVEETETTTDNNLYVEKLNLYRKIIMGLIVLCVILLFIIINKAIRGHGDDDFDGDVFAKAPTRTSRKLPRSIVFGGKDRDDEDDEYYDEDDEEFDDFEDDEDDEEEDDRDFSKSRFESESYEARRASSLNMMDLNDL